MRIEVIFTPQDVDENALRDRTVVMIDVLRASSSIITALSNGARGIIPVATVEAAVKMAGNLAGDVVLLAGERNAKMIQGFQLGNSPLEYTPDKVKGKTIVFSSTNGALALSKGRLARELAVCAFLNMKTAMEFIIRQPRDFVIMCSGTNGAFSLEDSVCAGMLVNSVVESKRAEVELADGALAAEKLSKSLGRNIPKMIGMGEHGRLLEGLGFGEDVKYCGIVNSVPVLPVLDGNVLTLKHDAERNEPALPLSPA